MQVSIRVANRLEDAAAVACEHGDEMLADMLTAEARFLQSGDIKALATFRKDEGTSFVAPQVVPGRRVDALERLAISSKSRAARNGLRSKARDACEILVTDAWLAEGHNPPE